MVTKGAQMVYRKNAKWLFSLLALIIALLILLPANALSAWNDVTASVTFNRTRPLYNYVAKTNYFDGSLTNTSGESFQAPIRLVIDSVTTPQVTVHNADGVTDDNKPYFDFSAHLGDGTFDPGETSSAIQLEFYNPNRLRFNFTWKILVEAGGAVEPPVNQPPVLDPIADKIIDEGQTITLQAVGSDPDGDVLTYTSGVLPDGATFDQNNQIFSWTPTYDQAGTYTLGFTVSDPSGLSSSADVSIIVNNVNRSPVLSSSPVTAAEEGVPYTYQVTAEDEDQDDSLSFELIKGPNGMAIDLTSGLITWTPAEIHVGLHEITVQASDGNGGTDTQTYSLSVAATVDRTPPKVTLACPTLVQTSGVLNIDGQGTDNVGVTRVSIYIDGLLVKENAGDLCSLSYNAPESAGATIAVRAVAMDAAENQGVAAATVTVVEAPDTTLPVIDSILLPSMAAPGESVTIRAEVTDDRGVAEVRFSSQGTVFGTDTIPPYEAAFTVPSDASAGDTVTVEVAAEDTSGNTATDQASLGVVDTADTEPPTAVTIQVAAQAVQGQEINLSVSAVDNVGLLKVVFFAEGVEIAEDTYPPYQVPYTIPLSKKPGSQVAFLALAVDFAGNHTDSSPVYTQVIAPTEGFIVGEVFDDTTGLSVSGALVHVISARGQPPVQPMETTTDDRGRYRFLLPEGEAALEIHKQGYSSCYRELNVQPGTVTYPLDARITPMGTGFPVNRLTGGNIAIYDNQISLYVPPGAFTKNISITLNKLSGQGLPALLPIGWAPVSAIHVGPVEKTPNTPLQLTIRQSKNLEALIAVRWDKANHRWVRLEIGAPSEGEGMSISLSGMGTVAVVKADTQPAAPPMPEVGAALSGVDAQSITEGVTADILPSPEIIFMQPGAKSNVWVALNNNQPLPSGTRIQVDFDESYERTDESWLNPVPMVQDFILFQGQTGFEAHFVASPSEIFDPVLLKEGIIRLTAHRPEGADGTGIVGPAGGTVTSPDGLSLTIPAGALASTVPVSLNSTGMDDASILGSAQFNFLGSVELDLGDATLSSSATLAITLLDSIAEDAQVLVVQTVEAEGVTKYELVAIASVNGNTLTASAGALGLPLPGIRQDGRYSFLLMTEPVGYVTGTVLSGGQAVANGLVDIDTLPFISLLSTERTSYALASTVTTSTVTGKDLTNGNNGTGTAEITAQAKIVTADLTLTESRPTVVSVSPADGATGVQLTATISVQFSSEMDETTINTSSFILRQGGNVIPGMVSMRPDKVTAVFIADAPFTDETQYELSLSTAIQDTFGQPFFGNQPDESFTSSFTTIDIMPPARPEPGQISISIPHDGDAEISGTLGTTEPGNIVTAINTSTGESVSVIAGNDGSFAFSLNAGLADSVEIIFADQAGNTTTFDPGPFRDSDGTVVIGSKGGVVEGPEESQVNVPPGAVPDGTPIRIDLVIEDDLEEPIPEWLSFLAGINLSMGDVIATEELKVSVPVPEGSDLTTDSQILVLQEIDVFGEKKYTLANIAKLDNGRLETASPPFRGVRQSGNFYFGKADIEVIFEEVRHVPLGLGVIVYLQANLLWSPWRVDHFAIFAIPVNLPYSYQGYTATGELIMEVPMDPVNLPAGSVTANVICSGTEPDLAIVDAHPYGITHDIPIYTHIFVKFNQDLDRTAAQAFKVFELDQMGNEIREVQGKIGPSDFTIQTHDTITFKPKRRLKFNTRYRIKLGAVRPACSNNPTVIPDIAFKTFNPKVIGVNNAGETAYPNDICVLDEKTIAVANGNFQGTDNRGVVIYDVSNPENPSFVFEKPFAGRTTAVHRINQGQRLLITNAGMDIFSNLKVLDVTKDPSTGIISSLDIAGSQLLSTDLKSLLNGVSVANVPPYSGLPRYITTLGNNIYVATTGIGVEAMSLSNVLSTERILPGIYMSDSCISIATVRDLVLAVDLGKLMILSGDLVPRSSLYAAFPVPGKYVTGYMNFTADVNGNGVIEVGSPPINPNNPNDEAFDLAFVVGQDNLLYLVDTGIMPKILTAIPINDSLRTVEIDPVTRLAYVSSRKAVHIVDISNPKEGSSNGQAIDVDADGIDDRILGKIDELPGAGILEISSDENRQFAYIGSQTNSRLYIAKINPGRLFVDYYDPEFPDIHLIPTDYYPDIGIKTLKVRAYNSDGTEGVGSVECSVIAPSPIGANVYGDTTIGNTATLNDDGLAKFYVNCRDLTPASANGIIRIKFTWEDNNNQTQITETVLKIKNTTNTNLQEVLNGESVFVSSIHAGRTARPNNWIVSPGYNQTPRPRHLAPVNDQHFDIVQEMLNQVAGRKVSAWNNGFRIVEEDGIYGDDTRTALRIYKNEFNVSINTDLNNRSSIFKKLMKDYSIRDGNNNNYFHHIIDRNTLVMDSLDSHDVIINPDGGTDTGLYELYRYVAIPFVEEMMGRAEQFRDNADPTNAVGQWISRNRRLNPPPAPSTGYHDEHNGESYSYGGKWELDDFVRHVSRWQAPTIVPAAYVGDLTDGLVAPGMINGGGGMQWPGLFSNEWCRWSCARSCTVPCPSPIDAQFNPYYWAGIDCAGFVQRVVEWAKDRNPATQPGSSFMHNSLGAITDRWAPPGWDGVIRARDMYTNNNSFREIWGPVNRITRTIHRGDLRVSQNHVSIIYSDPARSTINYYIIHAFGGNRPRQTYNEDLNGGGTRRFGRKVITSSWRNHHIVRNNWGVSRIVFWQ